MSKVGIPRALLYYQYYPVWRSFFEHLGAEVVTSPPTNRTILTAGISRAVADTCLPVKVFLGHTMSLIGKCDYIFIPSMTSFGKKTYNCSKIIGLPNITRAVLPECPIILDPNIDLEKGRWYFYHQIYKLASRFTSNSVKMKKAIDVAWQKQLAYRKKMSDEKITSNQALFDLYGSSHSASSQKNPQGNLTIALLGHPYITNDEYLNHRIIYHLQNMGANVLTSEMAPQTAIDAAATRAVGETHWAFEPDIIGAGQYYTEMKVDGIITLSAFGCGPDSMMIVWVEHRAKETKTPFLPLSLDEHSSGGAMLTRLEAFLDMIKRKGTKLPTPTPAYC
jgi:predicted nucleotide-binding protein (sugar kinase/HSP70/actin superfamily)